jgi:H+/Cl- antiporter ClcA
MLTVWRWIALAAFFVFVVSIVGVILSSQPTIEQGNQPTTTEHRAKYDNQEQAETLWDYWFPDRISLYTLVLTIFTALLAFGGLYQLTFLGRAEITATQNAKAAKDSADIARQALIAGQRAFNLGHFRTSR